MLYPVELRAPVEEPLICGGSGERQLTVADEPRVDLGEDFRRRILIAEMSGDERDSIFCEIFLRPHRGSDAF